MMKYYKVQEEKDYWNMYGKYLGCAIKDELLTEAEMKKWNFPFTDNFMPVEIKKTDTHWFFGSRFENK